MTCEPPRGCKHTDSPVVATVAPQDSVDPKLPEEGEILTCIYLQKDNFCLVKNKPNSLSNPCCFYCKKNIYINTYKYIWI